jgi:hypothetical protein
MTGFWKDGTPFTCGGNAYGGTTPTSWVYTADTAYEWRLWLNCHGLR